MSRSNSSNHKAFEKILHHFKLDEMIAWFISVPEASKLEAKKTDSIEILSKSVVKYHDMMLFNAFLPKLVLDEFMSQGYTGLQTLSFAMRYRITYLSLLSHLLRHEEDEALFHKASAMTDKHEVKDHLTLLSDALAHSKQDQYPVFGFSSLGAHLIYKNRNQCRAFDYYDIPNCQKTTHDCACEEHKMEIWWRGQKDDFEQSAQAKMFEFYSHKSNCDIWNEEELEELISKTWKKLSEYISNVTQDKIESSLDTFGLKNLQELKELGLIALRKKFLSLSLSYHPDRGGDANDFCKIRHSYDCLKQYLGAHQ